MPKLPFEHLNLRFNPFGELEQEERATLMVADLSPLLSFISEDYRGIQILDESGRGKTSLLLGLHRHFPTSPLFLVPPTGTITWQAANKLFVDEVQFLSVKKRKKLWTSCRTIVYTTHVDVSPECAIGGRKVMTIQPSRLLTVEKLGMLFAMRIEHARRRKGPLPTISLSTVKQLVLRCGTDVRAMEYLLYDAIQRLEEVGHVELSSLNLA